MKYRASDEIQALIDAVLVSIEALQQKADSEEGLTPEEVEKLKSMIGEAETLTEEKEAAEVQERAAALKQRMAEPAKPVHKPTITTARSAYDEKVDGGEVRGMLKSWLGYHLGLQSDPNANMKARSHNIELRGNEVHIPFSWKGLRYKNRTIMSTSGAGSGAELTYQLFGEQLVQQLAFNSPLLSLLNTDSTPNGNPKNYKKTDYTGFRATKITASGGSEVNPTIPEVHLVTDDVNCKVQTFTSGYLKVTQEELQDSLFSIESIASEAQVYSIAQGIEYDVVLGTGDGETGFMGLVDTATPLDPVVSFDNETLDDLVDAVPQQYRAGLIFVMNDATNRLLRRQMKDEIGRYLWDKTIEDLVEFTTYDGKKICVSQHMPDNTIVAVHPDYYRLRMVSGMGFGVLTEKYHPHKAWFSFARSGGCWVGPDSAIVSVALDE